MAKEKESFVFHLSFWETLSKLSGEDCKRFLGAMTNYAIKGIAPELSNCFEEAMWEGLRVWMDRDAARYKEISEKRSMAGKMGGAPKGNTNASKQPKTTQEQPTDNLNQAKTSKNKQKQPKQTKTNKTNHTDTDTDTDTDSLITERDNINSTTTTSHVYVREDVKFLEVWSDESWKECVCMNHKLRIPELESKWKEFVLHCKADSKAHDSINDLKSHFNSWLYTRKNESNTGTDVSKVRQTDIINHRQEEYEEGF